jgi:hypothetical protein
MSNPLVDFYRCPQGLAVFSSSEELGRRVDGPFFDPPTGLHRRYDSHPSAPVRTEGIAESPQRILSRGESIHASLDDFSIIDDLRLERYATNAKPDLNALLSSEAVRRLYYALRPWMRDSFRRRLQRLYLKNWDNLPFPKWPVDTSVEDILEGLLLQSMKILNVETIPFVWFWPDGALSSAIVTHDVETAAGVDLVPRLMDVDDEFGIKSSFQLVPEERYVVPNDLLGMIRRRNCEVNVHGLNHDGNMFRDRATFVQQAEKINRYVREFQAEGFRSACMYRNIDWFAELDVSYDMSVPNVAHLEPQRGGCCTVFPYFIGNILELPLTTSQDYTLFHILEDYTPDLWKEQMALITARHGLMSFITHPDYILSERTLPVYRNLLTHLSNLRGEKKVWIARPGDVNRWWRQRSEMKLEWEHGRWSIKGNGNERARVGYASIEGDQIAYTVECSEALPVSLAK